MGAEYCDERVCLYASVREHISISDSVIVFILS